MYSACDVSCTTQHHTTTLHYTSIVRAKQRAWALVWGFSISECGSALFPVFYRSCLCRESKSFHFIVDAVAR